MAYFSRGTKIFLVFLVVILGGYLGIRLLDGAGGVPPEFVDARLQGALIAKNIVGLSNVTAASLEKVNEFDRTRNYREALKLTNELVIGNQTIREEAVRLSVEVEKMTKALSEIKSFEARQAALEAIADRLALISRLINYSASMGELLETLEARFNDNRTSRRVSEIISEINGEAQAINAFNKQAEQAMERFDAITK